MVLFRRFKMYGYAHIITDSSITAFLPRGFSF